MIILLIDDAGTATVPVPEGCLGLGGVLHRSGHAAEDLCIDRLRPESRQTSPDSPEKSA